MQKSTFSTPFLHTQPDTHVGITYTLTCVSRLSAPQTNRQAHPAVLLPSESQEQQWFQLESNWLKHSARKIVEPFHPFQTHTHTHTHTHSACRALGLDMAGKRAPTVPTLQEISFNQKGCRNLTHHQALTVGMQLVNVCGDVCVYRYLSVWQKMMMCYLEDYFSFFSPMFSHQSSRGYQDGSQLLKFYIVCLYFCCYSKRWNTSRDGLKAEKSHTAKSPLAQHEQFLLFVNQNLTVLKYHFGDIFIVYFRPVW